MSASELSENAPIRNSLSAWRSKSFAVVFTSRSHASLIISSEPTQTRSKVSYVAVMSTVTKWPILTSSRYFTRLKRPRKYRITAAVAGRSRQATDKCSSVVVRRWPLAAVTRHSSVGHAHPLMSPPASWAVHCSSLSATPDHPPSRRWSRQMCCQAVGACLWPHETAGVSKLWPSISSSLWSYIYIGWQWRNFDASWLSPPSWG